MAFMPPTTYDPIERIWSGPKKSAFYDFNCSIGRVIHTSLKNRPNSISQICVADGKTATNEDILNWSVRLAQNFKQRGLRHDDVICISAKNSTYVTPAAVACLFNATPFHAVHPTLDVDTLTHVLTITKPKLIFCDAVNYENLKTASAAWQPELITVTGKVEGVTYVEDLLTPTKTEMFYQPEPLVLGGDQTVLILCSSGTTGLPKAVSMANHMFDVNGLFFTSEDVSYCASGLDWYSGFLIFLCSIANGCKRILCEKPFSAEHFLQLVETHKISYFQMAPVYASELAAYSQATPERLASLKIVFLTGGWLPLATLNKVQRLLKSGVVFYGYGSTEFGGAIGSIHTEQLGNTVGSPLPGYRVRIVNENGENLGHGEMGELLVHHGRKWSGYFGNPVETQRMQDPQGWFHSGDLGYIDEHNNLFIVDRKKDIYKCRGHHYWPNEIEAVIADLPDVESVCVVGLYDEKHGDAPTALVVKRPGSSLSADQIKQHVAERMLAEYKHLYGGVYFTDELPQNANGKVLRRLVKEKLTQARMDR